MKPTLTVLNGSLGGSRGNTAAMLRILAERLHDRARLHIVHLSEQPQLDRLLPFLRESHGFVIATGTYWDSWGSPLQRFLEEATELEAGDIWLGKPAATFVTMHSVGGKEVLSRLQGVLCTLGLWIPPMSGMVYSLANQLALGGEPGDFEADLWQLKDLEVITDNLLEAIRVAAETRPAWKPWPVDALDPRRIWFNPSS